MPHRQIKEKWRKLPYPHEHYEVSDQGRARSIIDGKIRILKPNVDGGGYLRISLWCPKKKRPINKPLHRAIMAAFVGPSKGHVSHLNCIKTDNRLENMEYTSQGNNNRHGFKMGRYNLRGKVQTKLKPKQVIEIFTSSEGNKFLSKKFKINPTTVWNIKRGKTWRHLTETLTK